MTKCELHVLNSVIINQFLSLNILYRNDSKFSDQQILANSVDPDETAPQEQSDIRVYTVCHSVCTFWINYSFCKTIFWNFSDNYGNVFERPKF